MSHGKIVASEPSHWTIKNPAPCWNGMKLKIRKGYNMPKFSFGRTNFKQSESIFDKLKKFKLQDLKNLKWKDLTPQQKKKVILGFVGVVLLLLLIGVFSENDEEAYKSNINSFIKESAAYDVTSTAKTTTIPAMRPMKNEPAGLTASQPAVIATRPASEPLSVIETSGWP